MAPDSLKCHVCALYIYRFCTFLYLYIAHEHTKLLLYSSDGALIMAQSTHHDFPCPALVGKHTPESFEICPKMFNLCALSTKCPKCGSVMCHSVLICLVKLRLIESSLSHPAEIVEFGSCDGARRMDSDAAVQLDCILNPHS